jgi:amidase
LVFASATELARAIQKKHFSSEEVIKAYLRHLESLNPKINALVQLTAEAALTQAREADAALAQGKSKGPLHGVPFTSTDLLDTAGVISTAGTSGRATFTPTQDATVVARLRAAGAILLGKTNVSELGLSSEADNLVYKWTDNPYDRSRTPGGSSGGEAAIIAAGGSPIGLGSEAGSSLRVPCHFCGVAGLSPTRGLVSRAGHVPAAGGALDGLVRVGPVARFVEDLSLLYPLLAGEDKQDPTLVPLPPGEPKTVNVKKLRVAFYTDNGVLAPTAETATTIQTAARTLAAAGCAVEEARPHGLARSAELFFQLVGAEGDVGPRELLQQSGSTELHRLTQQRLEFLRSYTLSTTQFCHLLAEWYLFRRDMLTFMDKYDIVLCPVSASPATPHGTTFDAEKRQAFSYAAAYTLTGWPAVTVRGGASPEGLPIGVQIVARPWRDDVALATAQFIETSLGGWQPPTL